MSEAPRTPAERTIGRPAKVFDAFALRSQVDRRRRNLSAALDRAEARDDAKGAKAIRQMLSPKDEA